MPQLVKISNPCVVFAKSEVLALARQGVPTRDILAALCDGVAERVKGLLRAVGVEEDFVISGGVSGKVGGGGCPARGAPRGVCAQGGRARPGGPRPRRQALPASRDDRS